MCQSSRTSHHKRRLKTGVCPHLDQGVHEEEQVACDLGTVLLQARLVDLLHLAYAPRGQTCRSRSRALRIFSASRQSNIQH